MTKEDFIKKLVWFEHIMQEYHKHTLGNYRTGYNRGGSILIGELIDYFTRRKYTPMYKQLLQDIKDVRPEIELKEYQALQKRITSAYEF